MKTKVKTIDINAKEWFDKVNGNSYFAGTVCVNFGLKNEKTFKMPFQYGYGDQYVYEAFSILEKNKIIKMERYPNGNTEAPWVYCNRNKVIKREHKQRGCRKAELMYYNK